MVSTTAKQRGVKILNRISDHDQFVRADRTQLMQALLNLMSNAAK